MTAVSVQEKPQTAGQAILKDEERTRCEVWTRVMGYFRPIESFNIGKKGEAQERTYFSTATPGDPGDSSGSGDSTDSGDSVREEAPWHGSPQPVS